MHDAAWLAITLMSCWNWLQGLCTIALGYYLRAWTAVLVGLVGAAAAVVWLDRKSFKVQLWIIAC